MTDEQQPAGNRRQVPILAAVRGSYSFVFENKRLLPAFLIQPALVYFTLSFLLTFGGFLEQEGQANSAGLLGHLNLSLASVLFLLFLFLPSSMLFVSWHRFVLLGENGGQPQRFYPLRGRHWKYFGYMVAALIATVTSIFLGIFAVALFLAFLSSVLGGLAVIFHFILMALMPAAYVILYAKLSFIFPAIAVEEQRYGVAESWQHTTGFVWPLSIGFILCVLPGWIVVFLLNLVLLDFIVAYNGPPLWLEVIGLFITTYCSLVGVTFTTFVFKYVTGWVPGTDQNQVIKS